MSVLEAVVGVQTPRLQSTPPPGDYTVADKALAWLADVCDFTLDEWQQLVLRESLAEREPERWSATEVALVVPRQNGKGAILEARELVGLFLLKEPLLIHSAHQFKTAQEHFLRLRGRVEEIPELKRRVRIIRMGAGEQGIELKSGARLRILARKGGSGRGFSAPFVAFDEAMDLPEGTLGAMLPTQSAMARRQRWYTGSAVDQFVHENGVVFTRVRERGIRGESRLAFFEWSLEEQKPEDLSPEAMREDATIAAANPGYGIRIGREAVDDELNSLAERTAAVERFGVGDWPATSTAAQFVIAPAVWDALMDEKSVLTDVVCLAVDVTPDRSWASVVAAGLNRSGTPHVELVEHRRDTGWIAQRLAELRERHDVRGIVCGGRSGAASLLHECKLRGVDLKLLSAADEAQAFGQFLDLVNEGRLAHLGDHDLASAVKGATKRPLGDAFAWDRRDATVDISPLVAATGAIWESAAQGWDDSEIDIW